MTTQSSRPRPHQAFTRDSDSKGFTVRRVWRPVRLVILQANDGSGGVIATYSQLRDFYTAS